MVQLCGTGLLLVERDVRHGRDHMDFSRWPDYSPQKQEKLLADIATVLKNREMPLPQYAFMHRESKLSDAEIDIPPVSMGAT